MIIEKRVPVLYNQEDADGFSLLFDEGEPINYKQLVPYILPSEHLKILFVITTPADRIYDRERSVDVEKLFNDCNMYRVVAQRVFAIDDHYQKITAIEMGECKESLLEALLQNHNTSFAIIGAFSDIHTFAVDLLKSLSTSLFDLSKINMVCAYALRQNMSFLHSIEGSDGISINKIFKNDQGKNDQGTVL